MNTFLIFLPVILLCSIVGFVGFAAYTFWHAHRHNEWRRLEYFLLGECFPEPATEQERKNWDSSE